MVSVTFVLADGSTRRVDALEGRTLMETAIAADIPGIIAECGGGAICGTCHVHVGEGWLAETGTPTHFEQDMLDMVYDPRPNSRLSCQITVAASLEGLVVHVPEAQAL